ncbi:MAG: hypothetical protein Q8Q39_01325 [bacterium]|nr:hypothetical protein [bacterium]
MVGLLIAVIFAAFLAVKGRTLQETYLSSTNFLFWWYVICGVATFLFLSIGVVAGTALASLLMGPFAALLGAGIATVAILAIVTMLSFLQMFGAYLLNTALHQKVTGAYEWKVARLVIGIALVVVGTLKLSS